MIEITLLQQLTAFAEYGTLSAAATHLHTSQPALTRSMKRLEQELGVSLFVRSKNRLALNETGKHAAVYARQVLAANQDFINQVQIFDRSLHTISIGFCAPVPQSVLTPIINNLYEGITISADMSDDADFVTRLRSRQYNLAVLHQDPCADDLFMKKCGHEDLYVSLMPDDPLAAHPQVHLSDLDGRSILLFTRIGFWTNFSAGKTPNANYLLQVDRASFNELTSHSDYPSFSSSYYIRRGEIRSDKVNIPLADPECHTDYYLACLASEKDRYQALFDQVTEETIV